MKFFDDLCKPAVVTKLLQSSDNPIFPEYTWYQSEEIITIPKKKSRWDQFG